MSHLSPAAEAAQVSAAFEQTIRLNTNWHVISSKWWASWCAYTGFSADAGCVTQASSGPRPTEIDNSALLDPEYSHDGLLVLRKTILDSIDYVLVDERSATLLEGWYGGGPTIVRGVIEFGIRKVCKVNLHPYFLTMIECNPTTGAPEPEKGTTTQAFSMKTLWSDVQELKHNDAIEAMKKQANGGTAPGGPSDVEGASTDNIIPAVEESLESRVRIWVKKTAEELKASKEAAAAATSTTTSTDAAAASSSSSSEPCTALVVAGPVIDASSSSTTTSQTNPLLAPNGDSTAMDIDEGEGQTAHSPARASSPTVVSSNSSSPKGGFEREWKSSFTRPPPDAESLDPDDRLDASDPNVRTTPMPVIPLEVDEWRLLDEDELMKSLEFFGLQPVTEVLIETQQLVSTLDSDGVQNLDWVWPRAAYHRIKRWNDFEIGDIVDVQDTESQWIEAKILAIKKDTAIYVKYLGWKSSWNAWIPLDSGRIAERNKHTQSKTYASSYSSSYRGYSSTTYYGSYNSNEEGKPEVSGAVGLKNLGNTCFMNSTLQCLSHCVPLTDYFLDESYRPHINRDNPLGCKGRVAEEYGKLIAEIWSDKYRSVAPREFKDVIGEFASQFQGYSQHDSQELLNFLLDGLHEDLNLVLKKPPTNSVDSNGRPDAVVAAEAWETYLKRNVSAIVDNFGGQFKSTVVCPQPGCGRVSVTFDTFTSLSVPLPIALDTVVIVHLVYADATRPIVQVGAVVSKQGRLADLKVAICQIVGDIPNPRRLVLGDVFSNRNYKYFEEDGVVSDIKSNDIVYAYECPEIDEYTAKDSQAGGFYPINVIFSRRETNPYFNPKYPNGHEPFRFANCALPRTICLPKKTQLSVRAILDILHTKVAPYLRTSATGEQDTLSRAELEASYDVIIADDKGSDSTCGHHDYTGWSRDKCNGCNLREYSLIRAKEDAEENSAAKRHEAQSLKITSKLKLPLYTSANQWEAMVDSPRAGGGASSDDEEPKEKKEGETTEAATAKEGLDSSSSSDSSAVIVPNHQPSPAPSEGELVSPQPTNASVDTAAMTDVSTDSTTVADGFVKVDEVPQANLDVPFEVKTTRSYSYLSDPTPRCSFVVRLLGVDDPSKPAPPAVPTTVEPLDADPVTSPDPLTSPPVDVVVPLPPLMPWFDNEAANREIKHASFEAVAKDDAEVVSVLDCVKAFAKAEVLSPEELWYCRDCKEHRQATKKFDLWKLPSVLVIHLKRFSYSRYSRDKISTVVNFPIVGLDLSEHIVNPAHQGELYDLFAVSNHMGGLGGGHYNAYVRNNTNGCWYLHDDSSVSRVRHLSDIRSSSAYVLFYRRRAPGVQVQSEAEIEEQIKKYEESQPKSSSSSSYPSSSWTDLD